MTLLPGRGSCAQAAWTGALLVIAVSLTIHPAEPVGPQECWAGEAWRTSSPEAQGMSSQDLVQVMDQIQSQGIGADSIILVRNGTVVLDATFHPFLEGSVHDVASVTKSITSLAVGIAIDKGFLKGVQEPVLSFFPDRQTRSSDENWRNLRIEHLLTMTSGLCRNIDEGEQQTGRMERSTDGLQYMLDRPLVSRPGSEFVYCSLGPHLLSAILTRATGISLKTFVERNLFAPLGIRGVLWDADPQGNSHGWGDLYIRPMDLARIGYLLLNEGRWQGRQIVSREWARASAKPRVFESGGTGYGYLWWVPKEPAGLYEGRGRGGQRLAVWPEKSMVAVLIGSGDYTLGGIGGRIVRAVKADGPMPEDPEAARLLERKVAEAAKAPAAKAVEPLPATAGRISGRTYAMETNPLGLTAFSLTFAGSKEAVLRLSTADREEKVIPVGLDGVCRISNTSRHHLPAGAMGAWVSDRDFKVTYREAAGNKNWRFTLHFDGSSARWTVEERTGLVDEMTIRAEARVQDSAREYLRAVLRDEDPFLGAEQIAVPDVLGGDGRLSGGHRLEQRDPKRGLDHRRAEQVARRVVGRPARNLGLPMGASAPDEGKFVRRRSATGGTNLDGSRPSARHPRVQTGCSRAEAAIPDQEGLTGEDA